jgi:hypothetical protein
MARIRMRAATTAAVLALAIVAGLSSPADSAPTFGTSASTGVHDNCNVAGAGGSQSGDATAVAPEGKLVESCSSNLIDSDATADAGIAQGNVSVSGGAFVLGSSHTYASASGPSQADGRAIAFELLTVVPTTDFQGATFNVTATFTAEGDIGGHADAVAELELTSALESIDQSSAICTFDCGVCIFGCTITPVGDGHYRFSTVIIIPVETSSPFLSVQTTLDTFAGSSAFPFTDQPGTSDFSDTGTVSLTLPAGFTFISDVNQGVLGSTTIPEPGTLLLLGASLGGLWTSRRRLRLPSG